LTTGRRLGRTEREALVWRFPPISITFAEARWYDPWSMHDVEHLAR